MDAPDVLLLDVNETLSDLEPLRRRFTDAGAPEWLLDQWFAATLRDGFALTAAGSFARFGPVATSVLEAILPRHGVDDPSSAAAHIVAGFAELPVHPDVVPGLTRLHAAGIRLVTFTNGSLSTSTPMLQRAGLLPLLEARLSVDDAGRWKPHPQAYRHAVRACHAEPSRVALAAVHPWDVDGAIRAGLQGVWIDRSGGRYPAVFSAPSARAAGFGALADALGA